MPSKPAENKALRVLIYDENHIRASILEEGLRDSGLDQIETVSEVNGLMGRIEAFVPDVIFMDLANPNRDMLEAMFQVSRSVARPIAMFVDDADPTAIEAAIDAGVSAYIVNGLKKERVKAILDVTVSRFNAFRRLSNELETVKSELADRKTIEKAKLLLMKRRCLTEEKAYTLMRQTAMSKNCRIVDVARSILMTADLFQGGG